MNESTYTFPTHLGQNVWIDIKVLPKNEMDPTKIIPHYLKGEIRSFIISLKGNTERKSVKIRIKTYWIDRITKKHIYSYRYFSFSVNAIGKTIFIENPEVNYEP